MFIASPSLSLYSLSLRAYARWTLQEYGQCLIVQTLCSFQKAGEDIYKLALYIRETHFAHLHQQFTGGLDLIMRWLDSGGVIKDQAGTSLHKLDIYAITINA